MSVINIIYLIASITSIFLYIMSVQYKKKKKILLMQTGASFCYFIVYLIKGMYSGVACEVLEGIKNIVFVSEEEKNDNIPITSLLIFLILLVISGIIFYDGILSLLPLFINILLFISTYYKNPQVIRVVMLICGVLWLIYNIYGGAYIICIGNFLEIGSATIALIRFKKKTS